MQNYQYSSSNFLKAFLVLTWLFCSSNTKAQSLDFGSFRGKPFKIAGGVSAGSTVNQSSGNNNRDPFIYNFSGNLSLSFYSFTMPITYNYTNAGSNLDYKIPFNLNRLSISPKYKWITTHIGDVNMTFSPYTLSGHQFTGAGVELNPNIPLKFAAMYGRLLKATEDDGNPNTIPAFERNGMGTKLSFEKQKYKFEVIGFYAKDNINSIMKVPDTKNVLPKENLVLSFKTESQLTKEIALNAEFSNSVVTQDLRAENTDYKKGFAGQFLNNKTSTQNFSAFKLGLDVKLDKMVLGISYEKIDPNYQTLGAYFFSNDLENIMINASRPFFNDKLNLVFNAGIQRDNLDNNKAATTSRLIGSINATAKISEKLVTNFTFSNQATTTNTNPDQFFQINQVNPEQNRIDQLNFRQISRNSTINANYNFKPTKKFKKNVVFNYAFNQVANEQGGLIRLGQLSTFHNLNTSYVLGLIKSKWNFVTAINYTINKIASTDSKTFGPNIGISKKFLKEKLNTQFNAVYNISQNISSTNSNLNFRFNAGYVYKDNHNFSCNASQVIRKASTLTSGNSTLNELIITLNYAYNFSAKKSKNNENESISKENKKSSTLVKVKFDNQNLEFEPQKAVNSVFDIIAKSKITLTPNFDNYIQSTKFSLIKKATDIISNVTNDSIKQKLKSIKVEIELLDKKWSDFKNFDLKYSSIVSQGFLKLKQESTQTNLIIESNYFIAKYNLSLPNSNKNKTTSITEIEENIKTNKIKISKYDKSRFAHFNLTNLLLESKSELDFLNKPEIKKLIFDCKEENYDAYLQNVDERVLIEKIEIKIADYYIKDFIKNFE